MFGNQNIAGPFVVNLSDNTSTTLHDWTVNGLSADSSTDLGFTWTPTATGTYTLIATNLYPDDVVNNDSKSTQVEVSNGSTPAITLTATGYKVKGVRWVKLE